MTALRCAARLFAAPNLLGTSQALQTHTRGVAATATSWSTSARVLGCGSGMLGSSSLRQQPTGRPAARAFATQPDEKPLRQGEVLEEPWHDKIAHNFEKGDRHVIQMPIDELSEHVSISNEMDKELAKSTDAQFVLRLVADHIDQFEGPSISTALVSLVQHADGMSQDDIAREITSKPAFKSLCNLVDKSATFDAFTLMHTLRSLMALNVHDRQLVEHVSNRLNGLIEITPAKQLHRVVEAFCNSDHPQPDSILNAVRSRLAALKDEIDPDTKKHIEKSMEKMSDWQGQKGLAESESRDAVKQAPPKQSRDSTGAPQQPTSFSHA